MQSLNRTVRYVHKDLYLSRLTCTKHHNTYPAVVVCQCRICCQDNVLLSKKFHISQSFCSIIHVNLQTDIWVNMAAYLVLQKRTKQQPMNTMLSYDLLFSGPKFAHLAVQIFVQFRRSHVNARWNRASFYPCNNLSGSV